jgi:hypothetical protein
MRFIVDVSENGSSFKSVMIICAIAAIILGFISHH